MENHQSLVHKIRLHGRRGKGRAESFSREKLRHAPQKEGGWEILSDLPPVSPRLLRPMNLMSRMNGKKTHTHTYINSWPYNMIQTVPLCLEIRKRRIALELVIYLWGTTVRNKEYPCRASLDVYTYPRSMYNKHLIPPKRFDIFSPITGGCSEGLGVLWFLFKRASLIPFQSFTQNHT